MSARNASAEQRWDNDILIIPDPCNPITPLVHLIID